MKMMMRLFVLAALVAVCAVSADEPAGLSGPDKPVAIAAAKAKMAKAEDRKARAARSHDGVAFEAAKRDIRELGDRVKFLELNPMGGTEETHRAVYRDLHDVAGFQLAREADAKYATKRELKKVDERAEAGALAAGTMMPPAPPAPMVPGAPAPMPGAAAVVPPPPVPPVPPTPPVAGTTVPAPAGAAAASAVAPGVAAGAPAGAPSALPPLAAAAPIGAGFPPLTADAKWCFLGLAAIALIALLCWLAFRWYKAARLLSQLNQASNGPMGSKRQVAVWGKGYAASIQSP